MRRPREDLIAIINDANSLLYDSSIYTVLGTNNPYDEVYENLTEKGYYLTAFSGMTILGFYSRIFYMIKLFKPKVLSPKQVNALNEIKEIAKNNKIKGLCYIKNPESNLTSDLDHFRSFMKYLLNQGLDLGLNSNNYESAWKQFRNTIAHLAFPGLPIGGKHIPKDDKDAILRLGLPIYDAEKAFDILRKGSKPTDTFTYTDGTLHLNSYVLISYIPIIRNHLISIVNDVSEEKCQFAIDDLKEIWNRQK